MVWNNLFHVFKSINKCTYILYGYTVIYMLFKYVQNLAENHCRIMFYGPLIPQFIFFVIISYFLRRHKHSTHVYCLYQFSYLYRNSFTVYERNKTLNIIPIIVQHDQNIKYNMYTIQITVYNVCPKGLQLSDSNSYIKVYNIQNYTRIVMRACLMLKML